MRESAKKIIIVQQTAIKQIEMFKEVKRRKLKCSKKFANIDSAS
jgi:hypothetical protein